MGSALCVRRSPDCALCGPRGHHMGGVGWGGAGGGRHWSGRGLILQNIFPSQDAPAFFIHPTKPLSSCTAVLMKADQTLGAPTPIEEEDGARVE